MDTDSMIFISRPNEYEPKTGKYLGQMTNEIDSKKGNFISKFVSAGPKNYSYHSIQENHVKGKGFCSK